MQHRRRPNLHGGAVGGFRVSLINNLYRLLFAFKIALQGGTIVIEYRFHCRTRRRAGKVGVVRVIQPLLEGLAHRLIADWR